METHIESELFNVLNELSDEDLFLLTQINNLYDSKKMKSLARILNVKHPIYNNEELERKIIVDFLNHLLDKNKKIYKPDDFINMTISEKQLKKAVKNIRQKSIFFKNEKNYWSLFFDTSYTKKKVNDKKYYLNTIVSILNLFLINLEKKNNGDYLLTIDKHIKAMIENNYKMQTKIYSDK